MVKINYSEVGQFLCGHHELLKINDFLGFPHSTGILLGNPKENQAFIADNYYVSSCRETFFIWRTKDNQISMIVLPVSKVRFQYDNVEVPYVKFRWAAGNLSKFDHNDKVEVMDIFRQYVCYAVICSKAEAWKPKQQKLEKEQ